MKKTTESPYAVHHIIAEDPQGTSWLRAEPMSVTQIDLTVGVAIRNLPEGCDERKVRRQIVKSLDGFMNGFRPPMSAQPFELNILLTGSTGIDRPTLGSAPPISNEDT